MTNVLAHYLVGYDKQTERVAFEYPIPKEHLYRVKEIARVDTQEDPDAIGCYELSWDQTRAIIELIGCRLKTPYMDYFLEAYSESENADPTTAARA